MAREVRADGHLVDSCGITRLGVDTATTPRRVQIYPVTTHEGADRGGRHLDAEALQSPLMRW
jgi:hypothetical protein